MLYGVIFGLHLDFLYVALEVKMHLVERHLAPQRFYPESEDIFKAGGRSILAQKHEEAHKAHLQNFRIVRSWFAAYSTNPELYEYMDADYKTDTEVKERCRRFMRTKMSELLPLKFFCPETGAKHEMPWPEDYLFEVIKNRKHEWRKTISKTKMKGTFHALQKIVMQ